MTRYIIDGKIAPRPSLLRVRSRIHFSASRMAGLRIISGPRLSHTLRATSSWRKSADRRSRFGSLKVLPGTISSSRVNPAGTGRVSVLAWMIDSGITIARVHDDIS